MVLIFNFGLISINLRYVLRPDVWSLLESVGKVSETVLIYV